MPLDALIATQGSLPLHKSVRGLGCYHCAPTLTRNQQGRTRLSEQTFNQPRALRLDGMVAALSDAATLITDSELTCA